MVSGNKTAEYVRGLGGIVLSFLLACVFLNPVQAKGAGSILPDLDLFIDAVSDGNADVLRGVYVLDVMAFPIVQQPAGSPGFVSTLNGVVTSFDMAARSGNTGLLAHNYLAGASFPQLVQGSDVVLIYGDGHTERFVVSNVLQYQALDPASPYSEFRNLDTQITMTAEGLFNQVYRGERHVTFQTCIAKDGNPSWGRLFVIAMPAPDFRLPSAYTDQGFWRKH